MPYSLDPEVAAAMLAITGGRPLPPPAPIGDVAGRRAAIDRMIGIFAGLIPTHDDVTITDFHTTAPDGHDVLLLWYAKTGVTLQDSPAVLYVHGGGMIAMGVSHYDQTLANYVHITSVPFLSVEYRLAPEFPAPIPVGDCYAGLQWLHANAARLGVDPSRIATMGDSGGGGVAACLPHFARERNAPEKIAKQILIYPMLDDRNVVPDAHLVPFATWNYNDNATAWQAVLGARCGKDGVAPSEAAARMTDAAGMPELYVDVGELDIFRDEIVEYARKYMVAGVRTELHVHPGVPHAWEQCAVEAGVSKRAVSDRLRAIMSIKSVGN